jgi:hypothetical protein
MQAAMLDGNVTPAYMRSALIELTGLAGSIADEQRKADQEYSFVLGQELHQHKTVAAARIVAETTSAFWRAREAKDIAEQVERMEMNCRHYLTSLNEEMRLAR